MRSSSTSWLVFPLITERAIGRYVDIDDSPDRRRQFTLRVEQHPANKSTRRIANDCSRTSIVQADRHRPLQSRERHLIQVSARDHEEEVLVAELVFSRRKREREFQGITREPFDTVWTWPVRKTLRGSGPIPYHSDKGAEDSQFGLLLRPGPPVA